MVRLGDVLLDIRHVPTYYSKKNSPCEESWVGGGLITGNEEAEIEIAINDNGVISPSYYCHKTATDKT